MVPQSQPSCALQGNGPWPILSLGFAYQHVGTDAWALEMQILRPDPDMHDNKIPRECLCATK